MAEDEVLIRMDLAEMLTEEGYDVVGQAGDGETAEKARGIEQALGLYGLRLREADGGRAFQDGTPVRCGRGGRQSRNGPCGHHDGSQ